MKKFLLSVFSVCLCAVCVFSLVGCKPKDYGATTTDTSKVTANGGVSCVYNGELYFINGTNTNDGTHNGATIGSIYKVAVTSNGEVKKDAQYTKVVDALVGYKNGSITIIGDFLYYAAPSTAKNKKGEVLYNRTVFARKNLKNGLTQELYTTENNSDSEEIRYAYYNLDGSVNLVVYEKTAAILTSFKVGNEVKTNFKKTNVTSAVFSENLGVSKTGKVSADNYIFYTMSAESNAVNTSANRVYRISANGQNNLLLSDSANISLLCVRAGKLVFSVSFGASPNKVDNIYAYSIDNTTSERAIKVTDPNNSQNPSVESEKYKISSSTYDDIIFLEEGANKDELSILFLDGKVLRYVKYNNGTIAKDLKLYTFQSSPTLDFIGTFHDTTENKVRDYVVFTNKQSSSSNSYVYKIEYNFADQTSVNNTSPEPVQLSTTKVEGANGIITPKIIGNYVFVFAADEDKNILQYQINIYTPKNLEDQNPTEGDDKPTDEDLKVGEGSLVGVKK